MAGNPPRSSAPAPLGTGPLTKHDQRRLADACQTAIEWHDQQLRKQTEIPYVSHLLAVASLVLEHGGSADQAIAGLLHDAVEDTAATLEDVRRLFGEEVARIVDGCTDATKDDKEVERSLTSHEARLDDWTKRKRAYVEQLRRADANVALVAACDKRHNLGTLLRGLRNPQEDRHRYMERFNAGPAHQIWYYESLAGALRDKVPHTLRVELDSSVAALRDLLPDAADEARRLPA